MGTLILLFVAAAGSAFMGIRTRNRAWWSVSLTFTLLFIAVWRNLPGYILATIVALGVILVWVALRRYRNKGVGLPVLAGVIVLVSSLTYGLVVGGNPFNNTPAGTPNDETVAALTVTKSAYTCDKNARFNIPALKTVNPKGRVHSDAIQTPFVSTTVPAKMVGEVKATVCTDPLYGAHVLNFLATQPFGSFNLASVNPWLNEFSGVDASAVNAAAAKYMAHRSNQNRTKAQNAEMKALENEWRKTAGLANTLLSKFTLGTVRTERPTVSYHLNGATGSKIEGLPSVTPNDDLDSRPALHLTLVQQDGGECLADFGFSQTDKGIARYSCSH